MLGKTVLAALLSVAALPGAPARAQEFAAEASFGFGYLGGKVDEPLVAVEGVPSDFFAYRQDSSGRSLSVAASRWFGGVPDDGATPLALLPFVARRSSLAARIALSSVSRDSYGVGGTNLTTITSRFSADASETSGALDGTLFLRPGLALHATGSAGSFRETQAYSSLAQPVGVAENGSYAPKTSRYGGSFGLLWRPSGEAALELAGFGATATTRGTRTDFLGAVSDTRTEADTLGAAVSGRLLLAGRRLAVEAAASYGATHGDGGVTAPQPVPFGPFHQIARSVSGSAEWYPLRTLGIALGASYGTSGQTQGGGGLGPGGAVSEARVAAVRATSFGASVRFFPRGRASAALAFSRTATDTVSPPDSRSFSRLRAVDVRATLTAALRF